MRDSHGRFTSGNTISSAGGRARAAKLTPARRREIAQIGFRAMVAAHFKGDKAKAIAYLTAKANSAIDPAPWNNAFTDPGPWPGQ